MAIPYGAGSRSIVDRMRGAALLDVATYEDVEHDTSATGQAAVVVALAAVAAAIGGASRGGLFGALVGYLAGWVVWAGITYYVGTRLFDGRATWGELLRTLGFAQAPGVLLVFAIVPFLGGLVQLAVGVWLLAAMIIAVRQALDVTTGKAVLTSLIGWMAFAVVNLVTRPILGGPLY